MIPNWISTSPTDIPLTGAAQIWRLPLPLTSAARAHLAAHLTAAETERGAQFRREADHWRFIAGRGGLRTLLAAQLRLPPAQVPLTQTDRGKPILTGVAEGIKFNVSHSGHVVLIALNQHDEIGVDVEAVRPMSDTIAIAKRFFAKVEQVALSALPEAERTEGFFALWTLKEAVLKATGQGIAEMFAGTEVTCAAEATLRRLPGHPDAAAQWSLCQFRPSPNYLAAAAVRTPNALFDFYDLKLAPA